MNNNLSPCSAAVKNQFGLMCRTVLTLGGNVRVGQNQYFT